MEALRQKDISHTSKPLPFLDKVPSQIAQGLKMPGFAGPMTYIDVSRLSMRTFWYQSHHFMTFYERVMRENSNSSYCFTLVMPPKGWNNA